MRKRDLLIVPVMIGVLMFSHVTDEPSVQANQVEDYVPYYATEEYQRIKQAEQEKQEQEALMLRASIEEYQEKQQEESERLFREHSKELIEDEEDEDHPELYILANCVEAEAGNQDDLGKRYVCDVILNRVDDPDFPNTITGVITQKYHFTSYWDGGMDRWKPTEETIEICREELKGRVNAQIIFFTAGAFNPYGTDAFIHGDHYFSTK